MTTPSVSPVSVLIVGAGPVGLSLAIELGLQGVFCLVLDETDGTIGFPTANRISCRGMEHLRRWGIADEARYHGFPSDYPRDTLYLTDFQGYELARFEDPANSDPAARWPSSPEGPIWSPKLFFDPILRQRIASLPSVDLRFNCRVVDIQQDEHGVTVEVIDTRSQRHERITTSYLAGCDGGRSFVRRQMGIELQGQFSHDHQLSVFFKASLLRHHSFGPAVRYWILTPTLRALVVASNGNDLWCAAALGHTQQDIESRTPTEWVRLILGDDIPFEVIATSPWVGHFAVAAHYQQGRVFLVGDAAHLAWPAGGFGMNTGIGDAGNLGWKLAATVQGWAGPALLKSYEQERRPVALRNVREAGNMRSADDTFRISEELSADTEEGARLRQQFRQLLEASSRGQEFTSYMPGLDLGYTYEDSPLCVPDGSPPLAQDPSVYVPSAQPGARAPHAWLADGRSTLDLFKQSFTLLRLGGEVPDTSLLEAAAQQQRLPLEVVDVPQAEILAQYESCLVLIRPDGHVAWRANRVPHDPDELLDRVRGVPLATS